MHALPKDIINFTLNWLDKPDLAHLAKTCKKNLVLVNSVDILWRKFCAENFVTAQPYANSWLSQCKISQNWRTGVSQITSTKIFTNFSYDTPHLKFLENKAIALFVEKDEGKIIICNLAKQIIIEISPSNLDIFQYIHVEIIGKVFLILDSSGRLNYFDLVSGRYLYNIQLDVDFTLKLSEYSLVKIRNNEIYIVNSKNLQIYDLLTGKFTCLFKMTNQILSIDPTDNFIFCVVQKKNSSTALIAINKNNAQHKTLISEFNQGKYASYDNFFALIDQNGKISIYTDEKNNVKLVHSMSEFYSQLPDNFQACSNWLIAASKSGMIRIWDIRTGKFLYAFTSREVYRFLYKWGGIHHASNK